MKGETLSVLKQLLSSAEVEMSRVFPTSFIGMTILLISSGVGFAACIKSYNRRMDRAWTIHDCVMERWVERESATGVMPTQQEENTWRRQCTQEWSAMIRKG